MHIYCRATYCLFAAIIKLANFVDRLISENKLF